MVAVMVQTYNQAFGADGAQDLIQQLQSAANRERD